MGGQRKMAVTLNEHDTSASVKLETSPSALSCDVADNDVLPLSRRWPY